MIGKPGERVNGRIIATACRVMYNERVKWMNWQDQGTVGTQRYSVVPRTLSFLTHAGRVLLLRGAASKRIWANKLNGVGGHLEPGEDPLSGARREVREETGLDVPHLELRAVIHISGVAPDPGVMMLVFVAAVDSPTVHACSEGELVWYPIGDWPREEMVEDLPRLLPRVLDADRGMIYGHYDLDPVNGVMRFTFVEGDASHR